jgi:hypothetical protein
MGEFREEASALSRLYSPVQPKALEVILKITNGLNSEKSYFIPSNSVTTKSTVILAPKTYFLVTLYFLAFPV